VDPSRAFKALGNPRRRAVFETVWKRGSGERGARRSGGVTVGEVARLSGYPQPTVSLYLQKLADAGLIRMTRRKREVFCEIEPPALRSLAKWLAERA
jgi:DNA-binding transcriptional ArsR family regulator